MGEDTFKFVMVMLIVAGCVVLYFAPELLPCAECGYDACRCSWDGRPGYQPDPGIDREEKP